MGTGGIPLNVSGWRGSTLVLAGNLRNVGEVAALYAHGFLIWSAA